MSKRINYELQPTELYSLAGSDAPSKVTTELAVYTAVSKPTKNVMTSQLQRPPLDEEIPQQQQKPTPLDDYVEVAQQQQQPTPLDEYEIPQQQQQQQPLGDYVNVIVQQQQLDKQPHQQPQQIVPHQEPVKKTQIAITIVMQLLILLALGVLLILVAAVLVLAIGSGGSGADEVDQRILQIVKNISNKQILFNTIGTVNDRFDSMEEALENSTHLLTNILASTSSYLENTSTAGVDEILNIQNKLLSFLQSISCKSIKSQQPNSPTGYYYNANSRVIFCNMGELCGSGGGWTRLAYLNMTDDTENCPSGFRLYGGGGVRACGRPNSTSGGCSSVKFPSNGISYSEICGRVFGYQYGTTDAVASNNNNINGAYVDGVSITHGSPRQHIWTLMAGSNESRNSVSDCPCNTSNGSSSQPIPSFINNTNYYCESGNPSPTPVGKFYPSDPLWDGKGCDGNESSCCSSPDLPWFHRDYGNTTTTDYIELRVCGDEGTNDEDVPVGLYEIYVK